MLLMLRLNSVLAATFDADRENEESDGTADGAERPSVVFTLLKTGLCSAFEGASKVNGGELLAGGLETLSRTVRGREELFMSFSPWLWGKSQAT
jgi:hypothetical protein